MIKRKIQLKILLNTNSLQSIVFPLKGKNEIEETNMKLFYNLIFKNADLEI